ncbi:MAG: hypothetical protein ACREVG_08585, partial [Burkholderiales bacterium]
FASEVVGAVRGVDPATGFFYDDTRRYIDSIEWLSAAAREKIFHGNVRKVYPRVNAGFGGRMGGETVMLE